jgi:hypothetical protein
MKPVLARSSACSRAFVCSTVSGRAEVSISASLETLEGACLMISKAI